MPEDTPNQKPELTVAAFTSCGWEEAVNNTECANYMAIFLALSTAARTAEAEEREAHGRVLQLLAFACAMHLDPTSRNEPFKPISVGLDGKLAVIPRDFTETHMAFFAQIIDDVNNALVKARLADLLWMHRSTRHANFALTAIDNYRSVPLDSETWASGALECHQRAITLARSVRGAAGNRHQEIETSLSESIASSTADDEFFPLKLAEVLETCELSKDQYATVATKLEALALEFEQQGDVYKERRYRYAAATWFRKSENQDKSVVMIIAQAEGWVKEADARILCEEQDFLFAVDCYDRAIKIYQTIPRVDRERHQIDERIAELQRYRTECREKSQGQSKAFVSASQDLTDVAKNVRSAVGNKSLDEAMTAFAGLFTISVNQLRDLAVDSLANSPLRAFISTSYLDADNRVIAQHSGVSGSTPSKDDEVVVRAEMAGLYDWMIRSAVCGRILPALDTLTSEHNISKADFVELARLSPVVPPRREILFGKALFYGFDHEFDTALHLLVPQIENMVRFHLKGVGAKTTNVDPSGIETENGLSTLMDLPQSVDLFGEDVAYEVRTLFCDHFGQNLRNNVAHGLVDDAEAQSVHSVYAWWYGLKIVFNTYWNVSHRAEESGEQEAQAADDGPES